MNLVKQYLNKRNFFQTQKNQTTKPKSVLDCVKKTEKYSHETLIHYLIIYLTANISCKFENKIKKKTKTTRNEQPYEYKIKESEKQNSSKLLR